MTKTTIRSINKTLEMGLPWTLEALQAAGLPWYGCESWVRQQVASGASWSEIARRAGGHNPRTVHQWCTTHFAGLESSKISHTHKGRGAKAAELVASGMTREQAAQQLGISKSAVALRSRGLAASENNPILKSQKLLQDRLRALTWPANLQQIADQLFEGNRNQASKWASGAVKAGHLLKAGQGVFDRQTPESS